MAPDQLSGLVAAGYLTIPVGEVTTAASRATSAVQLTSTVAMSTGTAEVILPRGATITRADGGALDLTAFSLRDHTREVTNVNGTVLGAVQYGIPTAALRFGAPVIITIPVGLWREREALDVFRSPTTNFQFATTPLTTCVVAGGGCAFTTMTASYFAVASPFPSGIRWWDATPTGPPTGITAAALPDAVELRWTDPPDDDLATIDVLRNVPPSTAISGTPLTRVPRRVGMYTDRTVVPATTYVYLLRAQDGSGNVRHGEAIAVITPSPSAFQVTGSSIDGDRTLTERARGEGLRGITTHLLTGLLYGGSWPDRIEALAAAIAAFP